jgi:ribosomal protein L39E
MRMLGSNKEAGAKRKLCTEEPQNLCLSPDIIRMLTSTTVRLERHVECRKRIEMRIGFWWENLKERDRLEDQGLDWRRVKLGLREIGWED